MVYVNELALKMKAGALDWLAFKTADLDHQGRFSAKQALLLER